MRRKSNRRKAWEGKLGRREGRGLLVAMTGGESDSLWGAAAGGSSFTVSGRVWLRGHSGLGRGNDGSVKGLAGSSLISLFSSSRLG